MRSPIVIPSGANAARSPVVIPSGAKRSRGIPCGASREPSRYRRTGSLDSDGFAVSARDDSQKSALPRGDNLGAPSAREQPE